MSIEIARQQKSYSDKFSQFPFTSGIASGISDNVNSEERENHGHPYEPPHDKLEVTEQTENQLYSRPTQGFSSPSPGDTTHIGPVYSGHEDHIVMQLARRINRLCTGQ